MRLLGRSGDVHLGARQREPERVETHRSTAGSSRCSMIRRRVSDEIGHRRYRRDLSHRPALRTAGSHRRRRCSIGCRPATTVWSADRRPGRCTRCSHATCSCRRSAGRGTAAPGVDVGEHRPHPWPDVESGRQQCIRHRRTNPGRNRTARRLSELLPELVRQELDSDLTRRATTVRLGSDRHGSEPSGPVPRMTSIACRPAWRSERPPVLIVVPRNCCGAGSCSLASKTYASPDRT